MRPTGHQRLIALMGAVAMLAGCSTSIGSASPAQSPSPSPVASLAESATPSAATSPEASRAAASSPTATAVTIDSAATTVVDGVRVRSAPRVADDSIKFEPVLPLGTQLYVLDGPVNASGYAWYEVVPLTSRTLPSGWVASADRDGEPWIEAVSFDCPPVPTDFRSLGALPPAVGLACFPRVPINVTARVIGCNCDVDGPGYAPAWFSLGAGSGEMLVEPNITRPPANVADWFWLSLDPAGQHPEVLPVGEIADVTGVFDHPAAASCTRTEMDGEPHPSQDCRLMFAVTKLITRQ